jgi:hypothetical protein
LKLPKAQRSGRLSFAKEAQARTFCRSEFAGDIDVAVVVFDDAAAKDNPAPSPLVV